MKSERVGYSQTLNIKILNSVRRKSNLERSILRSHVAQINWQTCW